MKLTQKSQRTVVSHCVSFTASLPLESNGPKEMQNENYKAAQNNPKDTHTKPKHKIEKKSLNDHNQMQNHKTYMLECNITTKNFQ